MKKAIVYTLCGHPHDGMPHVVKWAGYEVEVTLPEVEIRLTGGRGLTEPETAEKVYIVKQYGFWNAIDRFTGLAINRHGYKTRKALMDELERDDDLGILAKYAKVHARFGRDAQLDGLCKRFNDALQDFIEGSR